MAGQSNREIVKRGYLYDKKKGILDRKRWYVLWREVTGSSSSIQVFKDERAAAKMEGPKASINVHDIVKVHRVVDRKQSFEILCPGLGYRFMANSDVEADEWVASIRGLILYRREPPSFSSSLPHHTKPVTISPSSHTLQPHSFYTDPVSLHPSPSSTSGLPTPPDSSFSSHHHRRNSAESAPYSGPVYSFPPAPSPPSSSSGSSMASGSNVSCEPAAGASDLDTDVKFRVHVKEVEGLVISGAADLVLGDGRLSLQSPDTGRLLVSWSIAALRRYGASNVSVTIVTGRNCPTGAGKFQFYTHQSRRIYSHLHAMAVSKAAASKTLPIYRTGSEPGHIPSQPSSPPSAPGYQLEHSLSVPSSCGGEDYSQLSWLQEQMVTPPTHRTEEEEETQQDQPHFTSTLC